MPSDSFQLSDARGPGGRLNCDSNTTARRSLYDVGAGFSVFGSTLRRLIAAAIASAVLLFPAGALSHGIDSRFGPNFRNLIFAIV